MKKPPFDFEPFVKGQLCFVVWRRPKGKGKYRLILHEAGVGSKKSFFYGAGLSWLADPAPRCNYFSTVGKAITNHRCLRPAGHKGRHRFTNGKEGRPS